MMAQNSEKIKGKEEQVKNDRKNILNVLTGLSCSKIDDFPGSYSKILLGSARYFLVSTFLLGGPHSFLVEDSTMLKKQPANNFFSKNVCGFPKWKKFYMNFILSSYTFKVDFHVIHSLKEGHKGNTMIYSYISGRSFSRSLSRALSWRRDGMGGGGGGTGDGEGSRGARCPPLSDGLLASGLYVCVLGAGWAMVTLEDRL